MHHFVVVVVVVVVVVLPKVSPAKCTVREQILKAQNQVDVTLPRVFEK